MTSSSKKTALVSTSGESSVIVSQFRQRAERGYGITCSGCKETKSEKAFSNAQKDAFVENKGDFAILCLTCNGTKKFEIQCSTCDRVLGLNKFAKSQRKDKTTAECHDCVTKRVNKPNRERTWVAHEQNFNMGDEEWSDSVSEGSVESSGSEASHFSV
ncbi:hypothetical protein ANO11243_026340 [Dothideomycetidae sp. 11243]|nr:hypothetical protein ANO11243_026340 [fungal sp. No.11243]